MRLRSLTQHVKDQNWFAVWLDLVIVVVGVFIGIQVANWNEARVEYQRETDALVELANELKASIVTTQARIKSYGQAAEAGKRSLAFIRGNRDCADACWDRIVDFMHASQWQNLDVKYANYQDMRNEGFPTSITLIDAVEAYLAQSVNNTTALVQLPVYRSLVRQLISVEAQEHYWDHCWTLVDGVEEYVLDCPEGLTPAAARDIVHGIVADPAIYRHLTEWVGTIVSLPQTLGDQNLAAQQAADLIAEEINRR